MTEDENPFRKYVDADWDPEVAESEMVKRMDERIRKREKRLHTLKEVRNIVQSLETDLDADIMDEGEDPRNPGTYRITLSFKSDDDE